MKLGMLVPKDMTRLPFEEIVAWAKAHGFQALDAPLERAELVLKAGLAVGAIGLGRLPLLSPDADTRAEAGRQAAELIDRAAALGIRRAMIPHGKDPALSAEQNLERFKQVYGPLADHAARHAFTLAMENWPGWGMNMPISPEWWEKLFEAVPSPGLGLCLDPSHLVWLGIDVLAATHQFGQRIVYAHAKDTELLPQQRYRYGIFGRAFGPEAGLARGWWRYRLPGYGEIHWGQFITALIESGYDDVLAIEHEDRLWYGDAERNKQGLLLAKKYLEQFLL